MNIKDKLGNLERYFIRKKRVYRRVFGSSDGKYVLKDLAKKFEVHLPAFQGGKGTFDPLDAMRRDAYKEVFAYIELLANNTNKEIEEDDTTLIDG